MFPRKLQKLFTVQAYQELALKTSRLLDSLGVYDDDIGHRLVILHFLIRKRRRSCILHRARFLHVCTHQKALLLCCNQKAVHQLICWMITPPLILMRVQFRGAKSEGHFHHSIFSRTNFLLTYFVPLRCIIIIFVSHKIGSSLIKKINILLYILFICFKKILQVNVL